MWHNKSRLNCMANNLETGKKVLAVSMLAEGNSIRSIERITGVHRDTIMRLGVRIGEGCAKIQDEKFRGLNCPQIECDEIWGFVGAKRKIAAKVGAYRRCLGRLSGWTLESKLIPSFIVGKRDAYCTLRRLWLICPRGCPSASRFPNRRAPGLS